MIHMHTVVSISEGNRSWHQAKRSVWELDEPGNGLHL